jgi:hypothetical protein
MAEVNIMSDQDFAKLSRHLVDFAQQLLEKQGEFNPFAMTMDAGGGLAVFAADVGKERPTGSDLATFLSAALRARAKQGDLRAWGVCLNVGAKLPGYGGKVDAICCQLEHASARPVQIFVPFHKNQVGRLEFDKPVVLPSHPPAFQPPGGNQ